MSLLPSQCRAARAMLGFSQRDLAQHAQVAHRTIADFETGSRTPHPRTLKAIQEALEQEGVIFLAADTTKLEPLGPGVRLKAVPESSSGNACVFNIDMEEKDASG